MTTFSRRFALGLGLATAVAAAAPALAQTTHTVTISNFAFSPANLTISPGDRVIFVNQDGAPHTATADGGGFDTGRLGRGQQAGLTFNAAGSFGYFCAIHPAMRGQITVQ